MRKNTLHPIVMRFKDGNRKNVSAGNLEPVDVYAALAAGHVTNADEFYSQKKRDEMQSDALNMLSVKTALMLAISSVGMEIEPKVLTKLTTETSKNFIASLTDRRKKLEAKAKKAKDAAGQDEKEEKKGKKIQRVSVPPVATEEEEAVTSDDPVTDDAATDPSEETVATAS